MVSTMAISKQYKSFAMFGLLALLLALTAACNPNEDSSSAPASSPAEVTILDQTLPVDVYRERAVELQRHVQEHYVTQASFHSTITFSHPITVDEAGAFVETYDLAPSQVYAYAYDHAADEVITIGARLSLAELAAELTTIMGDEGIELLGVGAIIVDVRANQLSVLQGDPIVFLVDVSADEILGRNLGDLRHAAPLTWRMLREDTTTTSD